MNVIALANDQDTLLLMIKRLIVPQILAFVSEGQLIQIDEYYCHDVVNLTKYDALVFVYHSARKEHLDENLTYNLLRFLIAKKKAYVLVISKEQATLFEAGSITKRGWIQRAELKISGGGL